MNLDSFENDSDKESEITKLNLELEDLKQQLAKVKNEELYLLASFQNQKKILQENQNEKTKDLKLSFIEKLLTYLDLVEKGLEVNDQDQILICLKDELQRELQREDVEEITVKIGDNFDFSIHKLAYKGAQRVVTIEKIIKKGYRFKNNKIIRLAQIS